MARPLVIRDAEPGEEAALEALQRRSADVWEEDREQLAAHPDAIAVTPELVAGGCGRVAIGEGGERLGFSVILPVVGGGVELDGLFVEPQSMRAGVGRALVADAVRHAREAGAQRLEVIANPRALGFYARVGFVADGEAATRFGPAPRMRLDL